MPDHSEAGAVQKYEVNSCTPSDLAEAELAACIAIIKGGDAVDPDSAAAELPRAVVVAIARRGDEIVGVGAIKHVRTDYAARRANLSGAPFNPDTPELGYVAVDGNHRSKGLSGRIVAALLSKHNGPLFATTDNQYMKSTLTTAGFVQKGCEWKGRRGALSLWLKD